MIALFTDFGLADPYVGQVRAVLAMQAPGVPVIDLFHAVPNFGIQAGAYLLPAYTQYLPPGTVVMAVVDPGVGGPRRAVFVRAGDRVYVGPDNGLFVVLAERTPGATSFEITWRPPRTSSSFHGRDLFAPVAAMLARGRMPDSHPTVLTAPADGPWPRDLPRILYIDHYGNAVSGMRAETLSAQASLRVGSHVLTQARTFAERAPGEGFWYENANGLVEIAVNQGRADQVLGLALGDPIAIV
jgi:S-adenosylmethionine hydrolase